MLPAMVHLSSEKKRGCGYRHSGPGGVGIYLMGLSNADTCERIPMPLDVCPCCGAGIKQTRGFTWVQPKALFPPDKEPVCHPDTWKHNHDHCPMCNPPDQKHGLLWIGASFYATPDLFIQEATNQGISRRLTAVPRDLVFGATWVYLAHPAACTPPFQLSAEPASPTPGIFYVFKPTHIDLVIDSETEIPEKALNIKAKYGDFARIVVVTPEAL